MRNRDWFRGAALRRGPQMNWGSTRRGTMPSWPPLAVPSVRPPAPDWGRPPNSPGAAEPTDGAAPVTAPGNAATAAWLSVGADAAQACGTDSGPIVAASPRPADTAP